MVKIQVKGRRKVLIIGAGPAGSALARFFAEGGCQVDLYEKNSYVAGHTYDEVDEHGIRVHRYGPHYFRTDDEGLLKWLSRFTEWTPGRYYVRAQVNDRLVSMPINLATISDLKGHVFTPEDFQSYLEQNRVKIENPKNAEEQCLALLGKELYEALFKGYTIKQWGIHPKDLSPSVTARIPLRFNWDERYPSEKYQVMPKAGYTKMIQNILKHPNIVLKLNTPLESQQIFLLKKKYDTTIYTGPVDTLFNYKYGRLGYRSLRFEWKYYRDIPYVQPCVQINYPNDYEYTRTIEIKHVTGQICNGTTVCYEYPQSEGPPYYPLLTEDNCKIYAKYEGLVKEEKAKPHPIHLIGRLAEFKYFNMDQVFVRALNLGKQILKDFKGDSHQKVTVTKR